MLSGAVVRVAEGATVVTVVVRTVVIWQLRLSPEKPTPVKIAMCLKRYRSKHCAQADSKRQRMDSKSYFSAFVASSCDGIRKNCKSLAVLRAVSRNRRNQLRIARLSGQLAGGRPADVNLPAVSR